MNANDRIAKLERELAELKAAQAPAYDAEANTRETAKYIDELHQSRERAANQFRFRPDIQQKMNEACGTADLQDLVRGSRRPQGPSAEAIPSSETITGGHYPGRGFPSATPGWRDAPELRPPPGVAQLDKVAEGFAQRDRAARIVEDNRLRGALKR